MLFGNRAAMIKESKNLNINLKRVAEMDTEDTEELERRVNREEIQNLDIQLSINDEDYLELEDQE